MSFSKQNLFKVLLFLTLLICYQNCAENKMKSRASGTISQESNTDIISNSPPSPITMPSPSPTPLPQPTPTPVPGKVDVLIASGHMSRTVLSCDDGRTWIHDQSANDATRCWVDGNPNYVECDHTAYSANGLEYNDGWFFTSSGWGFPGAIRRSQDGFNWQTVHTASLANGLTFINNILYVQWGRGYRSTDLGSTLTPLSMDGLQSLSFPAVKRLNNLMIATGRNDSPQRFAISRDQGLSWIFPNTMQVDWIRKVASSEIRMVAIGHNDSNTSYSAASTDGGATWTIRQKTSNYRWEQLVFDGEKFISWGNGQRWISFDGLSWMGQPFTYENIGNQSFNGPIEYNPTTKTLVMITNNWGSYYTNQKALRSIDGGLTWTVLSANAFRGGHPIRFLVRGQVNQSACVSN
jgi:hypothetical protein